MGQVKRLLVIIGTSCALSFFPVSSHAATPSTIPTPTVSATPVLAPTPGATVNASKRAALEAARAEYRNTMMQAQNGRDLAFADANATKMLTLTTAGKDKVAMKAALEAYRTSATGIITVYKKAVATAMQDYKAAIALAKGK